MGLTEDNIPYFIGTTDDDADVVKMADTFGISEFLNEEAGFPAERPTVRWWQWRKRRRLNYARRYPV